MSRVKSRMFGTCILLMFTLSLFLALQAMPTRDALGGDETINVYAAGHIKRIGYWAVAGRTTAKGPHNWMAIYVGPDATGPMLAIVRVDRNGLWHFSEINCPIKADATKTISLVTQSGGSLFGVPVRVR